MKTHYKIYKIPKGKNKFRTIKEPNEELKNWQIEKLKQLYKVLPHECNHGFIPGRNIVTNAKPHVGKTYVLSLDIKDFFGNTNSKKVKKILNDFFPHEIDNLKYYLFQNSLPQGAPTSPYLANFALAEFDNKVAQKAISLNMSYTRYADDLTFSWNSKINLNSFLSFLNLELKNSGYRFAKHKTHLMHKSRRQKVTGIIVNEKINIPYEIRNNIRAYNHLVENNKFQRDKLEWVAGLNGYLSLAKRES